ncbi:MAG: Sec1 domain containing protein 1 [Marteilia pararefringens]
MTAAEILTDLIQIQKNCLNEIFNYNQPLNLKNNLHYRDWKVLVFDKFGEQLITPIFSVKELRDCGITLYLNVWDDKESIPDVSAIYFCRATPENIQSIERDIRRKTYPRFYLNFIDSIDRSSLEKIAIASLQSDCHSNIVSIYEQYSLFVPLFERFFCTDVQTSENFSLNGHNIKKEPCSNPPPKSEISDEIIDSIISAVISIGQCPWIIARNQPFSSELASKLNSKLQDYINNPVQKSVFINDLYPDNHLMVYILERSANYLPLMLHSWNYSDLINDCFGLSLNKVTLERDKGDSEKHRSISLLPSDDFWRDGHLLVLFDANEQISSKMSKYRQEDEALKNLNSNLKSSEYLDIDKIRMSMCFICIHHKNLNKASLDRIYNTIHNLQFSSCVRFFVDEMMHDSYKTVSKKAVANNEAASNEISFANFSSNLNLPSFSKFFTEKIYNNVNKYIPSQVQCQTVEELNQILKCNQASALLSRDFLSDFQINHPKVDQSDAASVFKQDVDNCKTIIVYVVGGGSFYEYQNIHENFKNKNIKVIYGCSSVYNFEQMIEEIDQR